MLVFFEFLHKINVLFGEKNNFVDVIFGQLHKTIDGNGYKDSGTDR